MQNINIFIIDANQLFREGLKRLLDDPLFQIGGEAADVGQAGAVLANGAPVDLLLLDCPEGSRTEVDFIRKMRESKPELRIVVLSSQMSSHKLAQTLDAGADGYLLKDMSPMALMQSLKLVMVGEKVFPTHLAMLLVSGRFDERQVVGRSRSMNGLSEREIQILKCLLNGYSNKVIANQLNITEATVKVHLKGVLKKINAANRTQAAIWALHHGLGNEVSAAAGDVA